MSGSFSTSACVPFPWCTSQSAIRIPWSPWFFAGVVRGERDVSKETETPWRGCEPRGAPAVVPRRSCGDELHLQHRSPLKGRIPAPAVAASPRSVLTMVVRSRRPPPSSITALRRGCNRRHERARAPRCRVPALKMVDRVKEFGIFAKRTRNRAQTATCSGCPSPVSCRPQSLLMMNAARTDRSRYSNRSPAAVGDEESGSVPCGRGRDSERLRRGSRTR